MLMVLSFVRHSHLRHDSLISLSYPGCCVFKSLPTSFPSREADSVIAAFIADIHTRVTTICGTVVKYSSKALTPLATLQPAVGCTGEHTNLKPVELIPQLDLNHFPVPFSLRISCPVMAAFPNESASFGVHPHPIHARGGGRICRTLRYM